MASTAHCSLTATSSNQAHTVGMVGSTYIPSTGKGWRVSDCPGPVLGSTGSHDLWMTSLLPSLSESSKVSSKVEFKILADL